MIRRDECIMGFRTGAYAKVWEIEPVRETATKIRISTSRKDRQTGEYEQDFSGYVLCIGTATAANAAKLRKGDGIRIGDCEVTTRYDKDRKVTYTNYRIYSFEGAGVGKRQSDPADPQPKEDFAEIDDSQPLPF